MDGVQKTFFKLNMDIWSFPVLIWQYPLHKARWKTTQFGLEEPNPNRTSYVSNFINAYGSEREQIQQHINEHGAKVSAYSLVHILFALLVPSGDLAFSTSN